MRNGDCGSATENLAELKIERRKKEQRARMRRRERERASSAREKRGETKHERDGAHTESECGSRENYRRA